MVLFQTFYSFIDPSNITCLLGFVDMFFLLFRYCLTESSTVPMYQCERSGEFIHYTLLCDHLPHCKDRTDENFCIFDKCPISGFTVNILHLLPKKYFYDVLVSVTIYLLGEQDGLWIRRS